MLTKKYFSIAEVAKITCLPAHKLRYIEKSDSNIEIIQIRGRRYYTKNNIDYIRNAYTTEKSATSPELIEKSDPNIIHKIDQLLVNFQRLLNN